MTLIVAYRKKPISQGDSDGIICLSDSLISEINDSKKHYTKNSLKILSLDLKSDFNDETDPKLCASEIGLAYAGNTSIALQTYITMSIFCKNLASRKNVKHYAPSIKSVAHLLGAILNTYYVSYGEQIGSIARVDFLIFGFCYKENKFKLFHVSAKIIDNKATTTVDDINLDEKEYYSIGSGEAEFTSFYKENAHKGVLYCFKEFIKTDLAKEKAIGGFLIKTFAKKGYLKYYAEVSDNNYDLSQINCAQIGGFSIIPYIADDYMISFTMNPFLG